MVRLMAFSGTMGSGKSTAIDTLKHLQDRRVHLIKFAQPLYDMQDYIYRRISSVHKRPEDFIKDRKLLQYLGTEWGRTTIDQDIWIKLWKEDIKYVLENYPNDVAVCDDVRFNNEAEAVKELGGSIVLMQSNIVRINQINTGHASEQGIDSKFVDHVIDNSGSLDELKNALLAFNAKKALW